MYRQQDRKMRTCCQLRGTLEQLANLLRKIKQPGNNIFSVFRIKNIIAHYLDNNLPFLLLENRNFLILIIAITTAAAVMTKMIHSQAFTSMIAVIL